MFRSEDLSDSQPTGILAFSVSLQLLYMNKGAEGFNAALQQVLPDTNARGVIAPQILQVCQELIHGLQRATDLKSRSITIEHKLVAGEGTVRLRGLGVPSPSPQRMSLLVILLDYVSEEPHDLKEVTRHFQLTERQRLIVAEVVKGSTNKEIAGVLGVSEQTIKEHLRAVMAKMNVKTRAAILMKALTYLSDEEQREGSTGQRVK